MIATEQKERLMVQVNEAIDTIRPHLEADSGDIQVVELTDDGYLKIRWVGTCENCSMNAMTKAGVEYLLKSRIPEIQGVQTVV